MNLLLDSYSMLMKYLYALWASILFVLPAIAGKSNAGVVYQSGYKHFSIAGVERNDTATIISLHCRMNPGDHFLLPKKNMYLDDERHNKYKLRYTINIVPGDTILCPYSGEYDFSMVFDPMPKGVRIFDLRAADEWYSAFAFWGIHQDDRMIRKIKHVADDVHLSAGDVCSPVSKPAVIKGHIKNYRSSDQEEILSLQVRTCHENSKPRNSNINLKERISENGYFEFVAPVANKSWTYIEGKKTKIPVLLIPDDTIMLEIENYQEFDMRTTYNSVNGNNTMANLMMADPKWVDWENARDRDASIHPSDLFQDMEKRKETSGRLVDYLTWKYHLSQAESHLLRLQMHSFIYEVGISRLNRNLSDTYSGGSTNYQGTAEDLASLAEVIDSYCFLKDIKTKDYSYFVLPSQYLLSHLSQILPIRLVRTSESRFKSLEQYLGQELDEEWRKRIDF